MRPADQTEYIVQCIREAGSMYEDDARAFLAEHDAHVLTDAKTETVTWLLKKASEKTLWDASVLASKVNRGAVRAFLGTSHYQDVMDARRAEVLTALTETLTRRMAVTRARTVSKESVLRFLRLEASVARAATGEKSSRPAADATPDFFQPGHRYAMDIWRFHCATVATHPTTGEPQAIGWIRVSDGSWTTYAYSAAEWGERWTDVTEGGADRG